MNPILPPTEPLSEKEAKLNEKSKHRFKLGPYHPVFEILAWFTLMLVINLMLGLIGMWLMGIVNSHPK